MSILIQEIEDYLGIKRPDLKRDGEPFTQADLIFDADQDAVNPSLASQEPQKGHWHVVDGLDGFYYLKEGMEPPENPLGLLLAIKNIVEWAAPIIFLAVFLIYCFLVKR